MKSKHVLAEFQRSHQIMDMESYFDDIIKWTPLELQNTQCVFFQHDSFREAFCGMQLLISPKQVLRDLINLKEWRESFIYAAEDSDLEKAKQLLLLLIECHVTDYDLWARIGQICGQKHHDKIESLLNQIVTRLVRKIQWKSLIEKIRHKLKCRSNAIEINELYQQTQETNAQAPDKLIFGKPNLKSEMILTLAQLVQYVDGNTHSKTMDTLTSYAKDFYHTGNNAYENGRYVEAIDCYSIAIELKAKFSEAYLKRGLCKYKLDLFINAIEDYTLALIENSKNSEILINRGDAYYRLEQFHDAITDYTKAIDINKRNMMAYYSRGLAYACLHDYKKTCEDFFIVIELSPNYAEAHHILALAFDYQDNFDLASKYYQKAIELIPGFIEAMSHYFTLLLRQGKTQEAKQLVSNWLGITSQSTQEIINDCLDSIPKEKFKEEELHSRLYFVKHLLEIEINKAVDYPLALESLQEIVEKYFSYCEMDYAYLEKKDIEGYFISENVEVLWAVTDWATKYAEVHRTNALNIIDGFADRLLVLSLPLTHNGLLWKIGLSYEPVSLRKSEKYFREVLNKPVVEKECEAFPREPIQLDLAKNLMKQRKFDEAIKLAEALMNSNITASLIPDVLYLLMDSPKPEIALHYLENERIQIDTYLSMYIKSKVLYNKTFNKEALELSRTITEEFPDKEILWWLRAMIASNMGYSSEASVCLSKYKQLNQDYLEITLDFEFMIQIERDIPASKQIRKDLENLLRDKEHKQDLIEQCDILLDIAQRKNSLEIKRRVESWFNRFGSFEASNLYWTRRARLILFGGFKEGAISMPERGP